jgi:hypothetical protein
VTARKVKSGRQNACRSLALIPAPPRSPSTGERIPSCQVIGTPSTIPVLVATECRKKVLNLAGLTHSKQTQSNQEIVPHFLHQHYEDMLVRDLVWILLISVTRSGDKL